MHFITLVLVLFLPIWTCYYFLRSKSSPRTAGKLPPGPYPFPIVGNIPQLLGQNTHQTFTKLSKTYGPVMSLHLGNIKTVVISSSEITKQMLLKHDQHFSNRNIPEAAQAHDHHKISMAFLPVGPEWRKLRKLTKEQMFSNLRLEASQSLRQEKLNKLCNYLQECSESRHPVNIGEAGLTTTLDLMSATLFSEEVTSFDSSSTQEFQTIFAAMTNIVGVPNLADFFPVLKPIDPQGIKKKADYYFGKLLGFIEDLINQRLRSRSESMKKNDLLEALLELSEGSEYDLSVNDIKHLLLDLFVGGSDTTASAMEWTMTELLLNPEKLSKAKQELKTVVGENKQVLESDISRLPYLQAVIKEVFRAHPPAPFLVPRKSDYDVEINGYIIPKDTQVIFNVWAVGRDSSLWSNPDSFEPERFLGKRIDFKGQDFELIPFGSGRRMCPGVSLANRMLHIMVATLIHNFDWKLEGEVNPALGKGEMKGISLRRIVPLKAIPIKP